MGTDMFIVINYIRETRSGLMAVNLRMQFNVLFATTDKTSQLGGEKFWVG